MISRLRAGLWNADERRLRAPWRIVLASGAYLLVLVAAGAALSALVGWTPGRLFDPRLVPAVGVTVQGVAALVVVGLAALVLDRRLVADYGLDRSREWWLDLGFGLVLGAALVTLVFAVELAAGWVRVTDVAVPRGGAATSLLVGVYLFLWVGVYEELLVRGYLLTNVAEGLRAVAGRGVAVGTATAASSALFGVLHAANPNATVVSVFGVALAGVVLALGYVLTGDLAIPIGLHVTWNAFQGLVYGFPVSGLDLGTSVVETAERGPDVATGGAFGPEAGLVGVGAMLVGAGAILAWVGWRRDLALAPVDVPALRWR